MENGGTRAAGGPEVIHILSARNRFRRVRNGCFTNFGRVFRPEEIVLRMGGRHGESGPNLSVRRAGADRRPAFQPAMSVRPHAAADGEVVRNRVCRGRKSGFGSARNPVFRFSAAEGTAIGMFQKTNMPRGIRHGACKSSVSERSNALTAMLGCRISARPFLRRP